MTAALYWIPTLLALTFLLPCPAARAQSSRAGLLQPGHDAHEGDGSVDLHFGPKAPAGLESNWIPTMGKEPYVWLRLYGPEEAFWTKSFKMPDAEEVH